MPPSRPLLIRPSEAKNAPQSSALRSRITSSVSPVCKGDPPPGDPFIAKVADIAGLSEDIVRRHRGRIPREVFAREIRRSNGEVVSLYDGTIARPARLDESRDGGPDPVLQPAVAAYGAAFNAYVADTLGYHTDLALPRAAARHIAAMELARRAPRGRSRSGDVVARDGAARTPRQPKY